MLWPPFKDGVVVTYVINIRILLQNTNLILIFKELITHQIMVRPKRKAYDIEYNKKIEKVYIIATLLSIWYALEAIRW